MYIFRNILQYGLPTKVKAKEEELKLWQKTIHHVNTQHSIFVKSKMASAEADSFPDTSRQETEITKLPPPSGRATSLGREKNAAQLRGWCQICGDAAYNRNFGALSCDSCKAFFRRNVNRVSQQNECTQMCISR